MLPTVTDTDICFQIFMAKFVQWPYLEPSEYTVSTAEDSNISADLGIQIRGAALNAIGNQRPKCTLVHGLTQKCLSSSVESVLL